jgi:hypothetical protein
MFSRRLRPNCVRCDGLDPAQHQRGDYPCGDEASISQESRSPWSDRWITAAASRPVLAVSRSNSRYFS